MYACFISSLLLGENKTRVTALLFVSNFFEPFVSDGKFLSFDLYWSMKGLIFLIISGCFSIVLWFSATNIACLKQLPSLFVGFFGFVLFFVYSRESLFGPVQI